MYVECESSILFVDTPGPTEARVLFPFDTPFHARRNTQMPFAMTPDSGWVGTLIKIRSLCVQNTSPFCDRT